MARLEADPLIVDWYRVQGLILSVRPDDWRETLAAWERIGEALRVEARIRASGGQVGLFDERRTTNDERQENPDG